MRFLSCIHRWFCHFDDDNYVNVAALVRMLDGYDADGEWYLGKTSIPRPMEFVDRRGRRPKVKKERY